MKMLKWLHKELGDFTRGFLFIFVAIVNIFFIVVFLNATHTLFFIGVVIVYCISMVWILTSFLDKNEPFTFKTWRVETTGKLNWIPCSQFLPPFDVDVNMICKELDQKETIETIGKRTMTTGETTCFIDKNEDLYYTNGTNFNILGWRPIKKIK